MSVCLEACAHDAHAPPPPAGDDSCPCGTDPALSSMWKSAADPRYSPHSSRFPPCVVFQKSHVDLKPTCKELGVKKTKQNNSSKDDSSVPPVIQEGSLVHDHLLFSVTVCAATSDEAATGCAEEQQGPGSVLPTQRFGLVSLCQLGSSVNAPGEYLFVGLTCVTSAEEETTGQTPDRVLPPQPPSFFDEVDTLVGT